MPSSEHKVLVIIVELQLQVMILKAWDSATIANTQGRS